MSEMFTIRGVVEGFYGPPWTHAQRLDMVEFLAERSMNTFVYSPKDDPFLRARWREPHTGAQLEQMSELVNACDARGVQFVPALSPGLSMEYSSTEDRRTLSEKFARLLELGASAVGLFLDDIPLRLQHPRDQRRFASLAEAHVHLITEIHRELPRGVGLFVCPTQYFGTGREPYISAMSALPHGVEILWTGRLICSPFLDARDAEIVSTTVGRKVTYWDNFPVNDVAMGHELHIGPYAGRDPDLWRHATGIIANAMEYYENSKVGIAQVARYLADPAGYDVETAWRESVEEVADRYGNDELTRAYGVFADNCRMSAVYQSDAHRLNEALENYFFGIDFGDATRAREELAVVAAEFASAARVLEKAASEEVPLAAEVWEWVQAFGLAAEALGYVPAAYERAEQSARAELRRIQTHLRGGGRRVCGDVLDMMITDILTNRDLIRE